MDTIIFVDVDGVLNVPCMIVILITSGISSLGNDLWSSLMLQLDVDVDRAVVKT